MNYEKKLTAMMADPSVRNWVKDTARKLEDHDPVDALKDCELLVRICADRLREMMEKGQRI